MSILERVTVHPLGDDPVSPPAPAGVPVVDDEAAICRALSAMLKADGYEVVTAQDGKEAVEHLHRRPFELAIINRVRSGQLCGACQPAETA
jgi:PleD family two-component response regulator